MQIKTAGGRKNTMEPNYKLLSKSLEELKLSDPDLTDQEITKRSGVHNIRKIISIDIHATPRSWKRLHKAFPDYIPMPEYIDDDGNDIAVSVVNRAGTAVNQAGRDINTSSQENYKLSPLEKMAIDAVRQFGSDADLKELIKKVMEQ